MHRPGICLIGFKACLGYSLTCSLDKLLRLSLPQFPHLYSMENAVLVLTAFRGLQCINEWKALRLGPATWYALSEAHLFIYLFIHLFIHLFLAFYKLINIWMHWVFVATCRLSLVAVSGGYSSLQCAGFSLWWLLFLWSMGSRQAGFSSCGIAGSVVVAHGL